MKTFALIALTCVVLAACGGDDGPSAAAPSGAGSGSGSSGGTGGGTGNGGGTGGGTGGTGGSGGSGGGAVTRRYEALPTASDAASFLTLVNGEGAKGYRYLSDAYYAAEAATRSIFVNDGVAQTYTYQLQPPPANVAAFVAQANAQGASGYRYEGPLTYGELYRKDGGSSATYTYATAALPAGTSAFIAQANGQGQSGYWFVGPMVVGTEQANLYMKNNASAATYTYDALTPTSNVADFMAQANDEGAKGYRAKGAMAFGSETAWVYVKDRTQSPVFAYRSAAVQSTAAGFIDQSNTMGAQGNAYLGDLALGTPPALQQASFYFSASNCTGFLCTTLNPLTQN